MNDTKRFLLTIAFFLAVIFAMVTIISSALVAAVVVLSLIVLAGGLLCYITYRLQRLVESAEVVPGDEEGQGPEESPADD